MLWSHHLDRNAGQRIRPLPMTTRLRTSIRTLLALSAGASGAVLSQAQVTPQGANATEESVRLEKFVVTGSNIPTAADALAVPVTIIGPRQIDRLDSQGNLLEVIRKGMPFFAGNGNLGNSNANVGGNSTLGGSQLSLRNLDTLVLVNGRRVSNSGAGGRGGRNFVDVNQFPVAAVESIEVLTDGASAIYGSDAVGGVVNIKLKNDYRGVEVGGRYAFTGRDDHYSERSAYVVAGAGNDRLSITASLNWSKTDPLFQEDRPFSNPIINRTATISGAVGQGSSFPTAFLDPALGSPRERNPVGTAATAPNLAALIANGTYSPATFSSVAATFDLAPYATLLLEQEQKTGYATGSAEIFGKKLEVYADILISRTEGFSQLAAQPSTPNITIPVGAPYNPLTVPFTQVGFRYTPAPRQFSNDSELTRYTVGLRGEINEKWSWDAALTDNDNELTVQTKNVLYAPNVARAVAGGYNQAGVLTPGGNYSRVITGFTEASTTFAIQPALDALARPSAIDPLALDNVFGTSRSDFRSQLRQIDVTLRGEPFEITPGPIGFAIGGDFRKEELSGLPDDNSRNTGPTARRWLGATFFDPFSRDRNIEAGYAEVRVPVTSEAWNVPGVRTLDLTAAYRYENYSDVGDSKVPKFGVRWQPFDDQVTLRYTYSEAFTAPALFSLFGPVTQGFTATSVVPNIFGVNGQGQAQGGSNPNLRPSTATTNSFGVVISPKAVKGLTVTVNYTDVDQEDVVGTIGVATILQSVEQLGPASPYHAQVSFNAFPSEAGAQLVTTAGELGNFLRAGNSANLIYVFDGNVNIAGQKVRALDVAIEYETPETTFGKFDFTTSGTFFLDYHFQALPSEPFYEYAGITTLNGSGAQGTIPGYRFFSSVGWEYQDWELNVNNTYIDNVSDLGPGGQTFATSTTIQRRHVSSYTAWDLALSYTIRTDVSRTWVQWLQGMKFTVGVNNVFNKLPPLAPQAFNESNVDISTYSPIGRLFFARAQIKF